MEALSLLVDGFAVALDPRVLLLAAAGCLIGTIVGALPGLGPVNGVAILIPLAFSLRLDPGAALILLACVYYGCMYGGRISSIMLNIPGDEPAMMTCLDGYPMAKAGKASEALALSAVSSFVGAMLATLGLLLFAPLLVQVAIRFGPAEYFALFVLAFATIGGVTGANPAKTLLSATLGLALGMVGLDAYSGAPRFTFDLFVLYDGFDPIVAIVGLFAISELLVILERGANAPENESAKLGNTLPDLRDVWPLWPSMLRGSGIGFVAGVLPGAGASLGAFLGYALEKRVADDGGFGKGDPRGLAAPEAANNAAAGGSLVPMLALGVPGSGTTAVLLALLISMNVQPGPLLFAQRPEIVWGLIAALFLANLILLALNLPLVGLFTRMLALPLWALMPFVAMVSFVGIFSISNSTFDLWVMVAFGVVGYVLRKLDIGLVPLVLGLLLGTQMEANFRRAMAISGGDASILLEGPIVWGLYTVTLALLAFGAFMAIRARRDRPDPEATP
jgi:putative tricarboxylic transport membrane protein